MELYQPVTNFNHPQSNTNIINQLRTKMYLSEPESQEQNELTKIYTLSQIFVPEKKIISQPHFDSLTLTPHLKLHKSPRHLPA